jgi:hypothetical protein
VDPEGICALLMEEQSHFPEAPGDLPVQHLGHR